MTRTDLWKALEETQLYISKYYATALTDEDKHDQLKAYIEKFVLDNGYLVDGFTDEELINRLYSEMVEYLYGSVNARSFRWDLASSIGIKTSAFGVFSPCICFSD